MVAYNSPEDAATPLGSLLLKTVPENQYGRKTFTHLATLIPISRFGLQKWLDNQRVPANRVDRLILIGRMAEDGSSDLEDESTLLTESRVNRVDFEPYVYNFPS